MGAPHEKISGQQDTKNLVQGVDIYLRHRRFKKCHLGRGGEFSRQKEPVCEVGKACCLSENLSSVSEDRACRGLTRWKRLVTAAYCQTCIPY